jgi:hypothetical protein
MCLSHNTPLALLFLVMIDLEIRRVSTSADKKKKNEPDPQQAPKQQLSKSAEADLRRKAVIAAAEARENKHKALSKPIRKVTKTTLDKAKHQQQETAEPLSEEAKRAAAAAKQDEAALAAQLGYNPYEPARSTAGQARTATTTVQHGDLNAGTAGKNLPTVAPPREAAAPSIEETTAKPLDVDFPPDFEDAYAIMVSANEASVVKSSCGIMKKLLLNATTKGQTPGEDAAKFRKVRLANPKIKTAIVDVQGAVELLLATGFGLEEQEGESVLIYPADCPGPDWLEAALQQLETV